MPEGVGNGPVNDCLEKYTIGRGHYFRHLTAVLFAVYE